MPIRVLLIDDHEMVVESLRRLLETTPDIDVVAVAGTAQSGLDAAIEHRPDVAMVDYRLPDADGAVTTTRILQAVPEVRVVMLTGSDEPPALRAALAAGCVGYLEKSSAPERLAAAIRSAAAGQTVISSEHLDRLRKEGAARLAQGELTARELDVLQRMGEGLSNQAIADCLFLSVNTVRSHAQTILEKLGAHSKLEAVTVARRHGLLDNRPR